VSATSIFLAVACFLRSLDLTIHRLHHFFFSTFSLYCTNNNNIDIKSKHSFRCPLFRHEPDCILKDNDMRGRSRIRLPPQQGDLVLTQLEKDCAFLSDVYKVMDYSLLGELKSGVIIVSMPVGLILMLILTSL
jgi:hypothetical protein